MDIKLLNIGFGNVVSANRIVAIVSPESAPIKRLVQDARDRLMLPMADAPGQWLLRIAAILFFLLSSLILCPIV